MAIQRTLKKAGNTAVSLLEKASKDPRKTEDMMLLACAAGIGGCQAYVTYQTGDSGLLARSSMKMYTEFLSGMAAIPVEMYKAIIEAGGDAVKDLFPDFGGGELGLGFGAQDYLEKQTGWHAGEYAGRLGRWWRDL